MRARNVFYMVGLVAAGSVVTINLIGLLDPAEGNYQYAWWKVALSIFYVFSLGSHFIDNGIEK